MKRVATGYGEMVRDLGQSRRVKLLAANLRASVRDFEGERRIRRDGLDATDLEIMLDRAPPATFQTWHERGALTLSEYEQILELKQQRDAELAA